MGGFLIIEASKLLEDFSVWETLKRSIRQGKITIEAQGGESSVINTITLTPEDMSLDVKVILVGSRQIYYLLQELDPELHQMFRVLCDFDSHIPKTEKTITLFSRLLKGRCESQNFPSITAQGIKRLIEHSSRQAENKNHLSAHIGDMFSLLAEADYIRQKNKAKKISHQHIDIAIEDKRRTN